MRNLAREHDKTIGRRNEGRCIGTRLREGICHFVAVISDVTRTTSGASTIHTNTNTINNNNNNNNHHNINNKRWEISILMILDELSG